MTEINLALMREQLEEKLRPLRRKNVPPAGGWIQAIRMSLGLTATQMAKKLSITLPSYTRFEEAEISGKITLTSLKKIANALDCNLVLALVPKKPLPKMLSEHAYQTAEKIVRRSSLHMALEDQNTKEKFQKKQIKKLAEEMIRKTDKKIWEDF